MFNKENCFVNRIRKTVSFEFPWGIEPQKVGFHPPMLYHWATETLRRTRPLTKFIWQASCMLLGSVMSIASSFIKRIGEMVNFELSKEIQRDVFFVLSRVRDNTLKDEGDLRKRCALYLQRFHTWCFPVCNALPQSRQRRHTHLMSPSAALQTSAPCYSGTDPHTPKDYNRYRTSSVNYQMNKKLHS